MHITLTGKPYAGKGETSKVLEKFGFEVIHMGELYREVAKDRGLDVVELNRLGDTSVDAMVDKKLVEVAMERKNEDIVFDSRIAWHFFSSYKLGSYDVFLDVKEHIQAKRVMGAKRDSEKPVGSMEEAIKIASERWDLEKTRYKKLYGIDNLNPKNYDIVVDTSSNTPTQNALQILKGYYGGEENGVFEDGQAVFQKLCARNAAEKRAYETKVEPKTF